MTYFIIFNIFDGVKQPIELSDTFVEKFKKINATNPKVEKYIEGINILRPALIFAGIYYGILPLFSTFMAEKVDKYIEKHSNKSQTKS